MDGDRKEDCGRLPQYRVMSAARITIGYDVSSIFGRNGIARYSRELLLQIMQRHDEVHAHMVGTRNQKPEMEELFQGNIPSRTDLDMTHERALGAPLRRIVRLWKAHEIRSRFSDDDVVHYLGPQKIFADHKRTVSTVHDLIPLFDDFAVDAGLKYRFPRMIAKQLQHSSAVVCPSRWVADTIRDRFQTYTGPINVTPLAAGSQFVPTVMSDVLIRSRQLPKDYMVFVGRIDVARKNLDKILSAWMSLDAQERKQTSLLIVTDSSDAAITRMIAGLPVTLDASVRFLTAVSTFELVQILSNAAAMIFASQAEGFGLPILEAMQCGCPVITANVTSMPEVGGDAAVYVEPHSIEGIRLAIARLLTDKDLQARLRCQGLERSKQFSWSKTADATIQSYRTCPLR